MMNNRVSLFLMGQKGYAVLRKLIDTVGPEGINLVVSSKDPNIQDDNYEPIKQLSLQYAIPFADKKEMYSIETVYSIAVGWRWLIHENNSRLIVFHDSLLPRYRGFAPLITALINGDTTLGVTALFASEEYDKGEILGQESISVQYPITIQEAINTISLCYTDLACSIVPRLLAGERLESRVQDETEASYSLWRDENDYRIDFTQSASTIQRFIDATGWPYKGASCYIEDMKIRILKAYSLSYDLQISNRDCGKVIFMQQSLPVVVCGQGLLVIEKAVDDAGGKSILPLQKFRSRLR